MDDYYKTFNIQMNATTEEIKTKYRELARKFHPDVCKAPDAHQLFVEIKNAFEILLDPDSRKLYNAQLEYYYAKHQEERYTEQYQEQYQGQYREPYEQQYQAQYRKQYEENAQPQYAPEDIKDINHKVYQSINEKANSNVLIQGLSGVLGFPFTLIVDGAVIFTHYSPMLNSIRRFYGRMPMSDGAIVTLIKNIMSEIIFDIVNDKILGNIPIIGIYFNVICAKTLTWRLGILFAMLSSRGEDVDESIVKKSIIVIRSMFPQESTFKFKEPNYATFTKMVASVHNNTQEEYKDKINKAMSAFV